MPGRLNWKWIWDNYECLSEIDSRAVPIAPATRQIIQRIVNDEYRRRIKPKRKKRGKGARK